MLILSERMPPRAVAIALVVTCALLGAAHAQPLRARVDLVEGAFDAFPYGPPSTFTGAVLRVASDQDLYVRPARCSNSTVCAESNFFPCCRNPDIECDPVTRLSSNPACVCSSSADRICLDPWTPYLGARRW